MTKTTLLLRQKHEQILLSIAKSNFEAELIKAAFDNLEVVGPLCLNNFCYALRELLRHMHSRLAPDEEIRQCCWFKPEDPLSPEKITRVQRLKYMLQGGLSDRYVLEELDVQVDPVVKNAKDAINTLSKFTHIEEDVFSLSNAELAAHASECLDAISIHINTFHGCRSDILNELEGKIDTGLMDKAISDSAGDHLATHCHIGDVHQESSEVISIGPQRLSILIEGDIELEHQYGSNSDVRNDMGCVMWESLPFSAEVLVEFVKPLGSKIRVSEFNLDDSSWYGQ